MALDVRLQVRCTREELEEFKELADENGLSLSDYIRWLLAQEKGGEE